MQRSALCKSRRELSNAYLLAKIGVDTAENEPLEVWGENSIQYSLHSLGEGLALAPTPRPTDSLTDSSPVQHSSETDPDRTVRPGDGADGCRPDCADQWKIDFYFAITVITSLGVLLALACREAQRCTKRRAAAEAEARRRRRPRSGD